MCPQSIENIPHYLEIIVIIQHSVRVSIFRYNNGNDDISVLLPLGFSHYSAYRLHNIHLRVLWGEKQYSIQRRHIHTFGKTTYIGQYTTLSTVVWCFFQPLQFLVSKGSTHRAIYMRRSD